MGRSAYEHFDIQAILRGFGFRFQYALFSMIRLSDLPDAHDGNREFLSSLSDRMGVDVPTSVRCLDAEAPETAITLGLSHRGMRRLGVGPQVIRSFPSDFTDGMARRASINGDTGRSHPDNWEQHWGDGVDVLVGISAGTADQRDVIHAALRDAIEASPDGIAEIGVDHGHKIQGPNHEGKQRDVEHFGFRDGISNTPIDGLSGEPRHISGAGKLDANRAWHPIAAGEFLYGYTDEIGEVPPSPVPLSAGRNGSFLVYRKLSQDIAKFREYVDGVATGFGVTADEVAERIVGRKRNGLPLVQQSQPDAAPNDFDYRDDERGRQCPLGSHIRRTNPRDSLGFQSLLVDRHRIVRRGITYGDQVLDDVTQESVNPFDESNSEAFPGQGLLFLALGIDIARQFEFVQSEWVNSGNDLNQGSARDPLTGTQEPGSGTDRMVYSSASGAPVICESIPRFVETRGGDYFFLPGLEACRRMLAGEFSSFQ